MITTACGAIRRRNRTRLKCIEDRIARDSQEPRAHVFCGADATTTSRSFAPTSDTEPPPAARSIGPEERPRRIGQERSSLYGVLLWREPPRFGTEETEGRDRRQGPRSNAASHNQQRGPGHEGPRKRRRMLHAVDVVLFLGRQLEGRCRRRLLACVVHCAPPFTANAARMRLASRDALMCR